MKRLLNWRLLTVLYVFAFSMAVVSCGEDDEMKPNTEQGNDGSEAGNQGSSDETGNGETNVPEDNTGEGSVDNETDLKNPDGGIAVDLNLPSRTLWADRNIGAKNPQDYGDYFAWGETESKTTYNWSTYKWCNGSDDTLTKYCTESTYGAVDNKTTLEPKDDAATANWGNAWCMPTETQMQELRDECTWTWITLNGVNGYKVTGSNGNSIFLPAAGYRSDVDLYYAGSCFYWTSSLSSVSKDALNFGYHTRFHYLSNRYRYEGSTMRAVIVEDTNGSQNGNQGSFEETGNGKTDVPEDNTGGNSGEGESDLENPDCGVAVDLGLPSGTLWADRNIGAENPQDYGDHFAWGETKPKTTYNWSTYKWCNGSDDTLTKYCTNWSYGTIDNKTTLEPEDDAATANWGDTWCMPTVTQMQELRDKCTWIWTTQNGVKGRKVTGSNGNSIFLPTDGFYADYWSSSLNESRPNYAWNIYFNSSGYDLFSYDIYRYCGRAVRAVMR